MSAPDFLGREPNPEQEQMIKAAAEHWRRVGNEAPVQEIARIEEAAKQLIGIISALQAIYFAVFAFSNLREQIDGLSTPLFDGLIWALVFSPIVLWIVSLFFAIQVFVPKEQPSSNLDDMSVNAWQNIRQIYQASAVKKLKRLHWSHILLVVSFGVVLVAMVTLALLPLSPGPPTHIIIVTPTP